MDASGAETAQSRKRQRSSSMQSIGSSTSNKRAASDPIESGPPSSSQDQDIDEYMASQDDDSVDRRFEILQELYRRPMQVSQNWYLVSRKWHNKWLQAHDPASKEQLDPAQLGPVDNSDLFEIPPNDSLKNPLSEETDVIYIPEEAWSKLELWYGKSPNPLPRRVIPRGVAQTPFLEVHPLSLLVYRAVKDAMPILPTSPSTVTLSETDTLRTLCDKVADSVRTPPRANSSYHIWWLQDVPEDVRDKWHVQVKLAEFKDYDRKAIEPSDKPLADESIQTGDVFMVEFEINGQWLLSTSPAPLFNGPGFFDQRGSSSSTSSTSKALVPSSNSFSSHSWNNTSSGSSSFKPARIISAPIEPGTLGLGNLGNTCFMNSALQCLAHTRELTEYFLAGVFKQELNPDNPLGMQGAIAENYANLIQRIWASTSSSGTSYAPREFKTQLARFAPQFSGYQQHDSQELVAFLLDGLHEDLNRVLKKPYVEKPDWPDNVTPATHDLELAKLAKQSWDGYKLRNDSVIVDLFQGQYQSTLVCPECNKVSITFDPFMYLTLPLPVSKKWSHKIYFIPWDDDKPHLKIPIITNANASFRDVRQLLSRWTGYPADNLVTMETFSGRFYKNLDDNVMVSDGLPADVIVCYQLPCHGQQSRTYKPQAGDPFIIPIQLEKEQRYRYGNANNRSENFGHPALCVISEEQSRSLEGITTAIMRTLRRWTTVWKDLYQWEGGSMDDQEEVEEVTLNGVPPVDTLTEISESGEVLMIQEGAPVSTIPEGDIVDEKTSILSDRLEDSSANVEEDEIRRVGPKPGVFDIRIVLNSAAAGHDSYHQRHTTLDQRMKNATDAEPSLLRQHDLLALEFDGNMQDYFFMDEHVLWKNENFEDFIHPEYQAEKDAATNEGLKHISLEDCLDEFTKEEKLGEDDLWYCPQCKKHQQATKKFDLWKVPDILVVHLKRFSNNRSLRDKIDALVEFPTGNLDLTSAIGERLVGKRLQEEGDTDLSQLGIEEEVLDQELRYELFGVDEHLGGMGGGHYRAYAMNHLNNKWYHFDDSWVTEADVEKSVNPNAYLLFYRRSGSQLGGPSHAKTQEAMTQARDAPVDSMDTVDDSVLREQEASSSSSSRWLSNSKDYPPGSTHPSIADNTALTSLSAKEWRSHNLESSNASSSAGMSTPPEDEDMFAHPDPLATASSRYDFPADLNLANTSPASSTGVEVDSDRDYYNDDWSTGNSYGAGVSVTSARNSPKWTGSEDEVVSSSREDLSESFVDVANSPGSDHEDWERAI